MIDKFGVERTDDLSKCNAAIIIDSAWPNCIEGVETVFSLIALRYIKIKDKDVQERVRDGRQCIPSIHTINSNGFCPFLRWSLLLDDLFDVVVEM